MTTALDHDPRRNRLLRIAQAFAATGQEPPPALVRNIVDLTAADHVRNLFGWVILP